MAAYYSCGAEGNSGLGFVLQETMKVFWELLGVPQFLEDPGDPRRAAVVHTDLQQPGRFRGAQDLDSGRCVEKPRGGICMWIVKDAAHFQGLMYPCSVSLPMG